ncbi:MAG: acylneuraminate cytidylyltransferase family protein [Candidatus Levybacteria bacterium]|nr:acylneuraminate cytidylyltransferase family protein [Candidatus Levybacteria bacterium]
MNLLITICARGGSKGIPGKNIKLLNGKPLLHYTLAMAQKFGERYKADILLSTDSQDILDCAAQLGYTTDYQRPKKLASDSAGKIDAIRDAWIYAERSFNRNYDFILDMDVTSPLRSLDDLEHAFQKVRSTPEALNIFSVNPAARNPYFNMVEERNDGFVNVVKSGVNFKSRQEAPKVYDMNASFYFFSRDFFVQNCPVSTTDRSLAFVMSHICFDLDHPHDFTLLELMIQNHLLDIQI